MDYNTTVLLYVIFYLISTTEPLQRWKNITGAPGTGVHSVRIGPFALIDVSATVLLAMLISYKYRYSFVNVFVVLIFISVPFHMMFGVETALIKMITGNNF